jgi:hypothetical protein
MAVMFNRKITFLKKFFTNHGFHRLHGSTLKTIISRLGVLGKFNSQSKLCHRILPSTTRPTKWPFLSWLKNEGLFTTEGQFVSRISLVEAGM